MSIGLVYSGEIRDNGPGYYVRYAMTQLGIKHSWYWPQNPIDGKHDFWLMVDDGRDEFTYTPPRPNAYWAVDTHLGWEPRLAKARHFDTVYTAQQGAAERMSDLGINAKWLPLACSPDHHPTAVELAERTDAPLATKDYDIAFVGHLQPADQSNRIEFLDELFRTFPNFRFETSRFFNEMASVYHRARIGVNHAVRDDLNMRFMEIASMGVPQLADDRMVGLRDLGFLPWVHYIPYDSIGQAQRNASFALLDPMALPSMEALRLVRSAHTYAHRVRQMLADADCAS